MKRTIVLVDDHLLFREAWRMLLVRSPEIEIVGEAGDAEAACAIVERTNPDVTVVDIWLAGTNGIALARELCHRDNRRRVLMLTMHESADFFAQSMRAGALGYALKSQSGEDIRSAMSAVASGGRYVAPVRADHEVRELRWHHDDPGPVWSLSAREREVFDLLICGEGNAEVARRLSISTKTVETHRTHIMRKLELHSLGDLVRFASRNGLLPCADPTALADVGSTERSEEPRSRSSMGPATRDRFQADRGNVQVAPDDAGVATVAQLT